MNCPSCLREHAPDASFCSQCGAKLIAGCPDCGRPIAPDAVFCSGCGRRLAQDAAAHHEHVAPTPSHLAAKILRDRTTLEGERRTVTVLFIDAVGSVATGERIDQEVLHRITHGAHALMTGAVHRFEGVAQFRGDGIMALFGAPVAHEDTARRAISAALAMRASLEEFARDLRAQGSPSFTYRIGLNTGPVIVGHIGDDLSMDYTAIGDTVNLAARMEQWAAPGRIYVTDQTRRLAAGYFEFDDLGTLEIKGKGEAVRAYEVVRELSARTRLDVASEAGLTPYVGRTHERSVLRSHLEQAARGHGQVVFISGEAGMGKSRLLLEFRRSLDEESAQWLTGQCISYGSQIPYLPIVDLVKHAFGIDETDNEDEIAARVDARTAGWTPDAAASLPYLKFLLGIDPGDERIAGMDPLQRRAGILDGLRAILTEVTRERPAVVVIEDLHWIDDQSEEALSAIVEALGSLRVLLILTYRPGYAHSLGDRTYYSRLALRSLQSDESALMMEGVMRAASCPQELRTLITARAEGNPFYIEEVTKALIETGAMRQEGGAYRLARPIESVHIPETIQEVILSRIDRLDRDAREAIQLASVIGREFTARLLARIGEAHTQLDGLLGELKSLELIYEKAYFPELSYMFKHALTHDVAYSTLLTERRRRLHLMVAAAIEELYAERLTEHYETLAYHYEQGEDWEKSLDYLIKSAEKAAASYANEQARAFYARANDICQRPGVEARTSIEEINTARGWLGMTVGDTGGAVSDFDRAVKATRLRGDRHAEGLALVTRFVAEIFDHDFERADATISEVFDIADGNDDVLFGANASAMMWHMIVNGVRSSLPFLEAAECLVNANVDPGTVAMFRGSCATLPHWSGRYDQAVEEIERWRDLIADTGQLQSMIEHAWIEGLARSHRGEYVKALAILQRLVATCDRVGDRLYLGRVLNSIGWIYGELADYDTAQEYNERSLDAAISLDAPDPEIEMNARLNLADNLIALGRFEDAAAHLVLVERVVSAPTGPERWMLWRYSQHYYHTRGELHLLQGEPEMALTLANRCLQLAEDTDAPKNVVKGRRLLAETHLACGRLDEADDELSIALRVAREVRNPGQLWKTLVALGRLRARQARTADAAAAFREALDIIERVATGLSDEDLCRSLLASQMVATYRAELAATTS